MKKLLLFIICFQVVYTYLHAQTWNGSTNTDWNTASNWSPAAVPTSTSNVTIPGALTNYPVLAANTTINGINMQSGSQLDVNGFTLTLNGVTTDISFTGATLNNSNVATDIVININTGSGGYATYFRSNTVNDAIFFNLTGTNRFFEGDVTPSNQFNGNATFNINDIMPVYISHVAASQYNGNLTINRTAAGTTQAFNSGATITGNFSYTNNTAGDTYFGNVAAKTSIGGTVNIAANYTTPNFFVMYRLINQTTGGSISVQNSQAFDLRKDTLKLTSLSITGYRGNAYAYLFNNSITGNVTTADDASYTGGYVTYIRNNVITGNTSFSNNGTNQFFDADVANTANKYIGNVSYNGAGGPLYIAYGDSLLCTGNLTINRTAAGTTQAFNSGATITGNFSYTNNTAGDTYFGNVAAKTSIGGTVNIAANYTTPNFFVMYRLINQTTGGSISVQNSRAFDLRKDTLKLTSLSITGYRGNAYAYFFNNSITGNVTTADDASYTGGYVTYIRNNVITGNTSFSNNGTNNFFDADGANNANKYIGNVSYNGAGGPLYIAYGDSLLCTGNLTINRTVAGTTQAFNSGATITGNFSYTNNTTGTTTFGNGASKTSIGGTVNIATNYTTPNLFQMYRLINQTTGGSISVQNSQGFDLQKDTLKLTSLSITGYRGSAYAYFLNNSITGNITTADDASYTGGYVTYIRNNVITGNTSFSNNGTNAFYDADGSNNANKYIGNITYVKNGTGTITIASGDIDEITQNLTLNSASGITLGKLKFNGSTDGIIDQLSTQSISISELTMEKTGTGKITLNKQVTLTTTATFTSGLIITGTGNELIFANGATAANASDASHVEGGPVIKTGNQAFAFPLGAVNKLAQLSISAPASTTDQFKAQYIFSNPSPTYDTSLHDVALHHVTGNEYWQLNQLVGSSNVSVTLAWDSLRSGTINVLPDLRVAEWNGSTWQDKGNGATTGNNVNGTIQTTAPLTSYGPVTLASATTNDPFTLTLTWMGLLSNSWNTSANWNIGKAPGLGNNVKINNGGATYQPQLTGNITVNDLLMTAGKLDLNGFTLTCSGTATLQGDSLLAGTLIANDIADVKNMKMTGKIILQKNSTSTNDSWFGNNKVITDSLNLIWAGGILNMQNNAHDSIVTTLKLTANGGTVNLAKSLDLVAGNLSLNASGTANINLGGAGNISVTGNFNTANSGTGNIVQASGPQLLFKGIDTANYSTSGTMPMLLNITLNKTGGVKLLSPLTIQNSITFTRGIIKNDLTNLLTLPAGSSVSNAWDSSYVDGVVTKIGNAGFTFPMGKENKYAPIAITAPSVVTDAFRAQYLHADPDLSGYSKLSHDPSLNHISSTEYWILDRTIGSSSVLVTLSWNTTRSGGVDNIPELRVARWNGTTWVDEGQGATTGTVAAGTIQSAGPITSFSPFTLASTTANNPLPVTLIEFKGIKAGSTAKLLWTTANEVRFNHFEIQRSSDAGSFATIQSILARGGNGQNTYEAFDNAPVNGKNYYRLKMVDSDGQFKYSQVIILDFSGKSFVSVYPNPARSSISIYTDKIVSKIQIIDVTGKTVKQFTASPDNKYNIEDLERGSYFIRLINKSEIITVKFNKL